MKWFKHLVGSLSSPDIAEAIDVFRGDGYLGFFGTLEVMSDEFDIHNPGIVRIPLKHLTKTLQLSRRKTLKILDFYGNKDRQEIRITYKLVGNHIILNCTKLKDLCDEWTKKELARLARATPESLPPKESDLDPEEEKEDDVSLPLAVEIYKKMPGLRILHLCERLQSITPTQYQKALSEHSRHMDWAKAFKFVVDRAVMEDEIRCAPAFMDSRLEFFEFDNRDLIKGREAVAKEAQREFDDLVEFLRDGTVSQDRKDQQKEDFTKRYSEKWVNCAQEKALKTEANRPERTGE